MFSILRFVICSYLAASYHWLLADWFFILAFLLDFHYFVTSFFNTPHHCWGFSIFAITDFIFAIYFLWRFSAFITADLPQYAFSYSFHAAMHVTLRPYIGRYSSLPVNCRFSLAHWATIAIYWPAVFLQSQYFR